MKKRILSALLALAMLLTLVPTVAFAATTLEGKGTAAEPYLIKSAKDWVSIFDTQKNILNSHYKLMVDIDLTGERWLSKTVQDSVLDGDGHSISNAGQPLFGTLTGATIKNLAIVDANITGDTNQNVGILTWSTSGTKTTIQNCYVSGSVAGSTNGGIGGLIGMVGGETEISNCAANVAVSNTSTNAGGLVGYLNHGYQLTISNCYTLGKVTSGSKYAGGLVGDAQFSGNTYTSIKNCVALQSDISSNGQFFEKRIAGSSNFETTYFNNNYAYGGMSGANQPNGKYTEDTGTGRNGKNVPKETCTTANFWNGLGFSADTWDIQDGKLPRLTNLKSMTGNPPTYLLDAAKCPVKLADNQSIQVIFQTTDADTATQSGEIEITYTGSDTLSPNDFTLSSSKDASVPITGLSVTALNNNTLTVSMAKSVTNTTAYLFYNSYCLGEITLTKKVNKVPLAAPTEAKWDNAKATWREVTNAAGYSVQLYKDGVAEGDAVKTAKTVTEHDFTSAISESGSYTFKVKATGNDTYADSQEVESGPYTFTQQTLEMVKTAADAALESMPVSNDTTDAQVLNVVRDLITNKKIHAAWLDGAGFALTSASDGENNGTDGKITGKIVLTLDGSTETTIINVDLTIKPKFSVTFAKGADDAFGDAPTLATVTAKTEITLPANTFTYYGKKFTGWSDGSKTYAVGAKYTMPSGNVTFTAQWENDVWNGTDKSDSLKGTGAADDPYIIASGADLRNLADRGTSYCHGYYKLMADIDMGGHEFSPIYHLAGIFDGNDHKITNLKIKGDGVYYGLFKEAGYSTGTVIKNLTLDASLTYTNKQTGGELGLLVSYASDKLNIENCYVTGTINADTYMQMRVGGLVGLVKDDKTTISQCYAGVTFTGGASNSTFGGLVGSCKGGTIENSYATPDMTKVSAGTRSGIASGTDGNKINITNCYAAGTNFNGAGIASSTATVTNSVSIFPEMKGSARIGVAGEGNYGFAGTVQRNNKNEIIKPSDDTIQGADATADQLKDMTFYQDTLNWSADIWEIRSGSGYAFPVLKGQETTPTLNLDLDPSVVSVTLNKDSATLPCGGTLQLTATVDVKNGADRTVVWNSSDTTKAVVDGSGKVTVQPNATSGEVKITATAAADGTKMATATVTADAGSHKLTGTKDLNNNGNSPDAVCTFYETAEDARDQTNAIPAGTMVQAGKTVYARITNMTNEDVAKELLVNGVEATRLNGSTFSFTMPCEDATAVFSCAVDLTAYNYVWFVGMDWSTWGTTATYSTTEWSASNPIGSLKITNIINGKKFASFNLKSVSAYDTTEKTGQSFTPQQKDSKNQLTSIGDYFVDTSSGVYPVLYVYNNKPGTIMVDIEVEDNQDATYNITKEEASARYYTLSTTTAKAGDTVTATLTQAGIDAIGDKQSMTLDYYGGLLVVMFPGQFHKNENGTWTASFTMPAQDITTRVYVSGKHEVTLTGSDKEVEYNGQPQTINSAIKAKLGSTEASEAMWGRYEVTYNGSTTPPTDVGTYTCTVKIPNNDPLYFGEMKGTVTLTITKSKPATPAAPTENSKTYNSVTLNPPTTFVGGTQIPSGYKLEYKCGETGAWQDSPTFTGLLPGTNYQFYARIKEDKNTEASASSAALPIETPPYTPSVPEGSTQYKLEIKAVPGQDALKNKVTEANSKITTDNVVVYSVTLLSSTDGINWEAAALPAGGITATLPYPAGSGMSGYTFVVMQGSAASATALSVSQKTAEGLQVKLTSLEAIAVGYCTASSGSHGNHGNGGTTTKFPFTDVAQGSYYYDAVAWAVDRGVTSGTSATTFSPDAICTRAQAVTFLWRAMGSPQPTQTENPFTDVSPSAYYYQAILWAVEQGITNGTSATTFSPDLTVTRAHTVTFLWRLAGQPAADEALAFTDVEPGSYYETAVRWAIQKQITNGTSAATFSPDLGCTRAQMVTFLYRDLAAQ